VKAPDNLTAFPDTMRVKRKGGRARWKDRSGRIYEWDSRHGTIELYDAPGWHIGEYDHVTGNRLKPSEATRRVEP
jgi:hypothetical protein